MSRWALPTSWAWSTTAQIAKIVAGGTPSTKQLDFFSESEGTPWITPADLSGFHEKYISRGKRNLTTLGIKNSSAQILPQGAILFSSRAPIGYCVIANNAIATNQGFKNLIVKNGISIDYIWIYFSSAKDYVESVASGTTFKEISASKMQEIEIPIPPLNEQRRIAAKVEALQARSAKAKKALIEAQALLEKFRQSVLAAAFRGDLTARWREEHPDAEPASAFLKRIRKERRKRWEEAELAKYATKGKTPPKDWKKKYPEPVAVNTEGLPDLPAGWCWASLDELIVDMHNGLGGKPSEKMPGVPILRISAVRPLLVNAKDIRYYRPNSNENITPFWVFNGDLLYTRYNGSLDLVGVCGMYKESNAILHPDKLIKVTAVSAAIAEYLLFASNSGYSRHFIRSQAKSTSGQCGISNGDLRRVPIPFPCAGELSVANRMLNTILAFESAIRSSCNNLNSSLEKLNKSLLAKAFRGELVAQDPTDEPASVLLERIAAEAAILSASDAKPQQARRGRKTKPGVAPAMVFPAAGREQRLLRLMEYIIYAYPGLSTTVVEEQAKLATYPAKCANMLDSRASAFRKALRDSGEEWEFSKADVVRFGRLWESLEANYGIRISSEGLCTMREGREPAPWPAMDALLPFFNKAYTIFIAKRHKYKDVQADLDSIGVMQKIA